MADPARSSDSRMVVVPGIDGLRSELGRLYVVVGVFDGLHLGHLYLLGRLREEAARHGARPAVVTFDHHPDEILTGAAPPLLCDPAERLERLEAAGVAVTVVQHFDQALRMTPFDAFIKQIVARTAVAGFLMTPESAFGHERRGTPAAVGALGRELGYVVTIIPSLDLDGRPVRSAEIRFDIASGDLNAAARLLGRPYAVVGEGEPVAGRVRLAFPMPVALPPAGAYRALLEPTLDGVPAVTSIVIQPSGALEIDARAARSLQLDRLRVTFVGDDGGLPIRSPERGET